MSIKPQSSNFSNMPYAGILADNPTFEDWIEKLANIRQVASQIKDEICHFTGVK